MRSRRPSPEHQETVSRRLALLSAEIAGARPEPVEVPESPAAGGEEWWQASTRVPPARRLALVDRGPEELEPTERADVSETGPDAVPWVPVPGRHAARRTGRLVAGALPETLRGRLALGPGQLAVVAVLVALGLGATSWWVVRGDADPPTTPGPLSSPAPTDLVAMPVPSGSDAESPSSVAPPSVATGTVTVDVAGKVRRPGIAVLDAGSRVIDALEAAGGARAGVALVTLNLARVLVDGEQILVGQPQPAGVAASAAAPPTSPVGTLVNLNSATEAELETLPEVGPVTAGSIITWRTEQGGFTSVEELLEVDGIGEVTLAQIAPYVTV